MVGRPPQEDTIFGQLIHELTGPIIPTLIAGLHAVHVIGGLVCQVVVTVKAYRGRYWSLHHTGLTYSALYWHFLGGVWLIVFVALLIGT